MTQIVYEDHGPVRLITINRPDQMNSLDFEANDELVEVWRAFASDEAARVAVITGAGGDIYRGLDEIEGYMRDVEDAFEDWHSEDETYVDAGGGRVALLYRIVGRGKGSGVPIDQPIAILWTVRDGKIRRGEGYLDPEEALAALGLKEGAHVE